MIGAFRRHSPPGNLTDFDRIPGQLTQWNAAVSGWFHESIALQRDVLNAGDPCQLYDQAVTQFEGREDEHAVVWNALPGTLVRRHGRARTLELADELLPLTRRMDGPGGYHTGAQWEHLFYRPQDECCEWRTVRDAEGRIVRIVFTSEPPEYWQALHGDALPGLDGAARYETTGDRSLLVELYQTHVSPEVRYDDLVCAEDLVDHSDPMAPRVIHARGCYNPYNRWNTTDGLMHLAHPANTLAAEVHLAASATVLRRRGTGSDAVFDPDALICCAGYGGQNRTSDPTIGARVNQLARQGFALTLRDPVGPSMHHLDMAGFARPDGRPIEADYFRVLRGDAGRSLVERAVFEVPEGEGFTVSDVRIGGVPIRTGGQVAEHLTMHLVVIAVAQGRFSNTPVSCCCSCCQDEASGAYLTIHPLGEDCPPTGRPAFAGTAGAGPPKPAPPKPALRRRGL
jgi:hypothetical protein